MPHRCRHLAPLVALVILLAPLSAARDPLATVDETLGAPALAPHGPIFITGDEGFGGAHSGVRSGSGTAEDPYVIASWRIVTSGAAAVHLAHTRAHVVIEDVRAKDLVQPRADDITCRLLWLCFGGAAIELVDAQNVTLRNVTVPAASLGLSVQDSRGVHVDGLHVGTPGSAPSGAGALVWRSEDVRIEDLVVRNARTAFQIHESARVHVASASVSDASNGALLSASTDVTVRDSIFVRTELNTFEAVTRVALVGNDFLGGGVGEWWFEGFHASLVCGNSFEGTPAAAFYTVRSQDLRVVGNAFVGGRDGFTAYSSEDVDFAQNLVADNTHRGVTMYATGSASGNAFVGNGQGVVVWGPFNATGNWWGAASGPGAPIGGGAGDPLHAPVGNVTFEPWLTASPDLSVDCSQEEVPAASPRFVVAEHVFDTAHGYRMALHAPAGVSIQVEVWAESVGDMAELLIIERDGAEWQLTSTGSISSVELLVQHEDIEVNPLPEAGGWGSTISFGCAVGGCRANVTYVAGATESIRGGYRVVANAPGTVSVDTVSTTNAGLLTFDDLRGTGLRANVLGVGGYHYASGSATLDMAHGLFGFASRWGGVPVLDTGTFTVSGPDGTTRDAGGADFIGEPTGQYVFEVRDLTSVTSGDIYVLYGDLAVPRPAQP